MDLDNILKLIEAVSASPLTSFTLDDGKTKLVLESKPEDGKTVEYIQQVTPMAMMGQMAPMAPMAGVQPMSMAQPGAAAMTAHTVQEDNSTLTKVDTVQGKVVKSPLVGLFYSAASPDTEDYVKVGSSVSKGQILGIIEAMKLMNEIECEYDGVIKEILIKNNDVVEYGQPLFVIG